MGITPTPIPAAAPVEFIDSSSRYQCPVCGMNLRRELRYTDQKWVLHHLVCGCPRSGKYYTCPTVGLKEIT